MERAYPIETRLAMAGRTRRTSSDLLALIAVTTIIVGMFAAVFTAALYRSRRLEKRHREGP